MRTALFAALLALATSARANNPVAVYSNTANGNSSGSFYFTLPSTITTNGNSLTISTDAVAGGTGSKSIQMDQNGFLYLNSGLDPLAISTTIVRRPSGGDWMPFAIGRASDTAGDGKRTGYFGFSFNGNNTPFLRINSFNDPSIGWNSGVLSFENGEGKSSLGNPLSFPQPMTTAQNNKTIGIMRAQISTGTAMVTPAAIEFQTDTTGMQGDPTAGALAFPANIIFKTALPSAVNAAEKMRLTSTGTLAIGLTAPTATRFQITTGSQVDGSSAAIIVGNNQNTRTNRNTALDVRARLDSAGGNQLVFHLGNDIGETDGVSDGTSDTAPNYNLWLDPFSAASSGINNTTVQTSAGRWGFGTTTPKAQVHISSAEYHNQGTNQKMSLLIDGDASTAFQIGASSWTQTSQAVTSGLIFRPKQMTLAQIIAYTPVAGELGGIVTCTNCAVAYSVCTTTGATIQGFKLGVSGALAECK